MGGESVVCAHGCGIAGRPLPEERATASTVGLGCSLFGGRSHDRDSGPSLRLFRGRRQQHVGTRVLACFYVLGGCVGEQTLPPWVTAGARKHASLFVVFHRKINIS